MISSVHNPKIQWVRALLARPQDRREAGAFVVEGVRLVEEALTAGWQPRLVLFTAEVSERGQRLVAGYAQKGVALEEVTPAVLKSVSDTETPQGILAVLPIQGPLLPEHPSFVLIVDAVRDPGNLGTILRTASAAGVEAVLLPPGTTDAFGPKVVRAAMGAHFRLPLARLTWPEIRAYLVPEDALENLHVYLADAGGGLAYHQADLRAPLALIVGGEAEGAGHEAQRLAKFRLHIPMPGKMESLNAAAATAILLFEVVRQRA